MNFRVFSLVVAALLTSTSADEDTCQGPRQCNESCSLVPGERDCEVDEECCPGDPTAACCVSTSWQFNMDDMEPPPEHTETTESIKMQAEQILQASAPKNHLRNVCGVSLIPIKKITGGEEAAEKAWPWLARLFFKDIEMSTLGSLITEWHVLTLQIPFYCVCERKMYCFTARLGEHNKFDPSPNLQVHEAKDITQESHKAPYAMFVLKERVRITNSVRPICLPVEPPMNHDELVNKDAFIAGWGSFTYKGTRKPVPYQTETHIISDKQCRKDYPNRYFRSGDEMVCAANDYSSPKAPCRYDVGGPLMVVYGDKWYQMGILNNSVCKRHTAVYAWRITHYLKDILNLIHEDNQLHYKYSL